MKTILALLTVCLLATTASAQLTPGTYHWYRTCLADGVIETPASTGREVELQISDIHEIFQYVDGSLVEQAYWDVSYAFIGPYCEEIWWTDLAGGMEITPWFPVLEFRSGEGDAYRLEQYLFTRAVDSDRETLDSVKAMFLDRDDDQ